MAITTADKHPGDHGSATAASGAASGTHVSSWITTESLTTAAAAVYTLTFTNPHFHPDSICLASVALGTSTTGTPALQSVDSSTEGQVVIKVLNAHASAAFNGTLNIKVISL